MKRVAVKFCGNCNPHINTGSLYLNLRGQADGFEFVPVESPEYECLLVISGCPVDCATRPHYGGKVIIVAGPAVNCIPSREDELAGKVLQLLQLTLGAGSVPP
ncbi:MAG: hypothetical protein ACYC2T_05540 [Bacillota bacterium]